MHNYKIEKKDEVFSLKKKEQFSIARIIKRSHHSKGEFTIEISDTGIGISLDNLKELFQPFRQAGAHISR